MKNIKKLTFSLLFTVLSIVCFIVAINISIGYAAGTGVFTMMKGASVKTGTNTGLRFTAVLPESMYEENATYGMLIAPEDYVSTNDLTVENVFGENSVYDWAIKDDDGNWNYTAQGKTRIINISYSSLEKNDSGEYLINGSIVNILDKNIERNFVGRAYKKVEENGSYTYTMSNYINADRLNSTRSMFEVAELAVKDNSDTKPTDEVKKNLRELYLDKVYLKNFTFDSATGTITKYIGEKTSAEIPDQISGVNVVAIGESAFADNTTVTSVTIPSTIKTIGANVFSNCSKLTSVDFSENTGEIVLGIGAFMGSAVKNIQLPQGITEIPASCFQGTTGDGEFVIPSSVTSIGDGAFLSSKYTSFTFEDGTSDLKCGKQVFAGASMTSFEIPTRMVEMGGAFFQNAANLTTLTFAEDRTKPLTAYKIEGTAAGYHLAGTKVTSLNIPGSVGEVPDGMANNVALTSLILGEGITKINPYAFFGTSITSVTFPKSLTEIDIAAFQGTSVLTNVTFTAGGTENLVIGAYSFTSSGVNSINIPARTISIGDNAFQVATSLSTLTFEKGGTADLKIGAWSFQACAITALEIPARTTSIGAASFAGNPIASLTFETGGTKSLVFENGVDATSKDHGYHFDACQQTLVVLPSRTVKITLPNVFPSTTTVTYEG